MVRNKSFSENFPYALNGWFLAEITLANNFKKFSFVTIFNILQSSLKKIWILISFPMLGQGKYVLSYFSPMLDVKWDTLHDLLPFVQFKKREKHPCRSATFSKVEIKVTILRGSFHVFWIVQMVPNRITNITQSCDLQWKMPGLVYLFG